MKATYDLKDRIFDLLKVSSFSNNISGGIFTEPDITIEDEAVLITSPDIYNGFQAVDRGKVVINLLIPDSKGASNTPRFRFLSQMLYDVLDSYTLWKGNFTQYMTDNAGQKTTNTINQSIEYFHFEVEGQTGITHDPERQGYSYMSVVLDCWIEK